MQQLKWHQLEQQAIGIQILPTLRTRPSPGLSVVGATAVVLTLERSTSATASVARAAAAHLVQSYQI